MTLFLNVPSMDVCSLQNTAHDIARVPILLITGYWLSGREESYLLNQVKLLEDKDPIFPLHTIQTIFLKKDICLLDLFLNPPKPIFPLSPLQHIHKRNELFMLQFPEFWILPTGSLHGQINLKHNSEKLRKTIYLFVILLYYSRKHTLAKQFDAVSGSSRAFSPSTIKMLIQSQRISGLKGIRDIV